MVDNVVVDTDNKEFNDALSLVQYTSQSIFLTGKAGTGKSTFLRYICEQTRKKYVVLAPTGVAAINAGGCTIHSFFKMPFRPILPDDPDLSLSGGRIYELLKYSKKQRQLLRELELVIIDEISMVRADMIDFIESVEGIFGQYARSVRRETIVAGRRYLSIGTGCYRRYTRYTEPFLSECLFLLGKSLSGNIISADRVA